MEEQEIKAEEPKEALPRAEEPKEALPRAEEPEDALPSPTPLMQEVETLRKLLEDERKKSEDRLTTLRYLQADYDNFRRRAERETTEKVHTEIEKVVTEFLPILDELEMAIGRAQEMDKSFSEGVSMILKKLRSSLEKLGLQPIEAIGKEFDPTLHEAVGKGGSGKVVGEIRRGYAFRGRVLRPSAVRLSDETQEVSD